MLPGNKPKPLIQISKLNKAYIFNKQSLSVLHNINLSIEAGQFVSIIGPSGSGKSTLLHLIGGLDQPTSGTVEIAGQNLHNLKDQDVSIFRNQKIGFVFQDFHLLENLTVEENISLPLLIKSQKNHLSKIEENQVKSLLKELELDNRATHKPAEISGGQKQRVAIGRALINNPEIILADEPTGNLDSLTGQQIINLLKKIHQDRQITMIIITHDQKIAQLADQIIQIEDGKIVGLNSQSPSK